ncbi:3-(methylthio)propionyl-CoA ligase [Massilia sp. MB5]|uniref:3-(methylthio)propionyl-CoA ligase n=1 Tax=Massilia sp. MB5 TaxID=2919578 RepID=UPI001F0CE78F|nr:3-(methylthio)propionyl-CoA ligase [Massilia sp. MB5]UMR29422.1 3-(methylthio)propionyl-CoA ligase [Massilia sp. MB5]
MRGLMQSQPLLISDLLTFAERFHGQVEIVSRRVEGDIHRYTFRDAARRARQVAYAIDAEALEFSDRVATLAWNGYRHVELYFGVSGSGRVLHTINPRLTPEQVRWMVRHAQDRVFCFELSFLPLVQAICAQCPSVERWVALCGQDKLPANTGIPNLVSYEAWIGGRSDAYTWPRFEEDTASSLCYTSGTSGDPKGVLYSHRSTVLHSFAVSMPDALCLSARDVVLPVVPMFHVNAWGLIYAAAAVGFKLVLPGPSLDGASVYELIEQEEVTMAAGVPTVWQMLLGHMQGRELRFSTLRRTVIGGAAVPPAMYAEFADRHGVEVIHAWGMTETSPVGTVATLNAAQMRLDPQEQHRLRLKQGHALFGVDMRIVDELGQELSWDGKAFGDLQVRGPWIISAYYSGGTCEYTDPHAALQDGWFATGDVATIDADGFMQITDRSKDVIKSGGEWISSVEIENVAMLHPAVAMAACIGIKHPKWDERPVIVVMRKPDMELSRDDILALFEGRVAKWQIPDDVLFVEEIPLGATGKVQKNKLRALCRDYVTWAA